MSGVGAEPGKELEGFACSGSCHVDLAPVLLETEGAAGHCPQGTPPDDLESRRLPVLLAQVRLSYTDPGRT